MNSFEKLTKYFFVALFLLITNTAYAQFSVGGGLVYGTEIENIGLNIRAGYQVTEAINANAGFSFFFAGDGVSFNTINLDGHYAFLNEEKIAAYGLAGLNIAITSFSIGFGSTSATEIGLNLGAGAKYQVSEQLDAFFELKYVISEFDQLVPELGAIYKF